MSSHDSTHEQVLAQIIIGDLGKEDPMYHEVTECPQCRDELIALRDLEKRLGGAGEFEGSVLGEARDQPEPDLIDVDSVLRDAMRRSPERSESLEDRRGTWPWRLALVAALVVGGLWLGARLRTEPDHGPEIPLGNKIVELREPVGLVTDFGPFRWTCRSPVRGFRFEVRESSSSGRVLVEARPVDASWQSSESLAGWPDEIWWQVTPLPVDGSDGQPEAATARRR